MYSKIWGIVLCFFLALSSLVGCGGGKHIDVPSGEGEAQLQTTLNQTWTLAIFPFDTAGKSKLSGEEVANLLITELIGLEGFKITEREALQEVLGQLGLGMSDLVDASNRQRVGKMLGTKLLCWGSVNEKVDLITARVVFTETSEMILAIKGDYKNERKDIEEIAQKLKDGLRSPKVVALLNQDSEQQPELSQTEEVVVEVRGYGAVIDGDLIMAKELALKDAYTKAIAQGCGVKLIRKTQVENFRLVQDKILTESVGYVASYEVLNENPNSQSGYEVVVNASVSQQPLSDAEKLRLMVKYLLAEPRIAVLIEGETKGESMTNSRASIISGQIASRIQKAGFSVVDAQTIEAKKKEFADSLNDEDAARLGSMLDANVTVRGNLSTEITGRTEEIGGKPLDFPIITATTMGTFRIVLTDTAEIIYSFSHDVLPQKERKGAGSTDEAASGESLDNFIAASADKLVWGLAEKLGEPIRLRMELRNATLAQAKQFEQQISEMPEQIVLSSEMLNYQESTANYQIKTPSKKILQKKLQSLDPSKLGAKELVFDTSKFGIITMSLEI